MLLMFNASSKGGLQFPTKTLMEHLVSEGHDVSVVSNAPPGNWQGVTCIEVPEQMGLIARWCDRILVAITSRLPTDRLRRLFVMRRLVAEWLFPRRAATYVLEQGLDEGVDLCVCAQHFCAKGAIRVREKSSVPFVVIGQGHVFDYPILSFGLPKYLYYYGATKQSYTTADGVIVVGRRMLEKVAQYRGTRSHTFHIPNGVFLDRIGESDDRSIDSADSEKFTLLYLGRLSPEKGITYLLHALAKLEPEQVRCLVVGQGPDRDALERLSETLGLAGKCEFIGAVERERVGEFYRRADAVVVPSLAEGHPSVVIEAMSYACPVIGSEIVGIEDVIEDGHNGLLVAPKDAKALANAIAKLATDKVSRYRLAEHARESVRAYDWHRILPRLESALRIIVEGSPRG